MVAPKTVIWTLDPHTKAKHEILQRYLQAWTIILANGNYPEILYVDGFAGPGLYSEGESGSPILAIQAALSHKILSTKLNFLFIEKDVRRADHLQKLVDDMNLPPRFHVRVAKGLEFVEGFRRYTEELYRRNPGVPTFVFIDPFGWTGIPFEIIKSILSRPSSEVFVNFMYEEINRFISHEQQVKNFTDLFGTDAWQGCVRMQSARERNRFLHDLYVQQLRNLARAKYVRSFEMSNSNNVTDYFLFFSTNSLLGLKKMKEAMWRIDESGDFRFSDATDPTQSVLFEPAPNLNVLEKLILRRFEGEKCSIEKIEHFILADTPFRETHYKKLLKKLEQSGRIQVMDPSPLRRKGTFGDQKMIVLFPKRGG